MSDYGDRTGMIKDYHAEVMRLLDEKKALETERDQLIAANKNLSRANGMDALHAEIDALKAELVGPPQFETINRLSVEINDLQKDRDTWRSLAEGLAKEFQLLKSYFEDQREVLLHKNDIRWEALEAYDAAKRGTKLEGNPAKGFGGYIDCALKEKEK